MKLLTKIVLSVVTILSGTAAFAHTQLEATVPSDAATIAEAPEALELTFTEAVRLTALSIQKDGGQKQSLGPLSAESSKTFSVAMPATIDEGHYVVTWRALSEDTHVMTGEFMFAVGAEGSHAAHTNHAASSAEEHGAAPAGAHGGAH